MKFNPGDLVEIVSGNINNDMGPHPLYPGMRGIVQNLFASSDAVIHRVLIPGPSWLVTFAGGDAVCQECAIRKVPPDPGRYPGSWDKCPWQPGKSVTSS